MALSTGEIINERYRIARRLGQGGMGAVFRAWDLSLNLPVALKEMIPDPNLDAFRLQELRDQFRREAQILATLSHPNLPRVTDFFEWNGNVYLIMDFIEGESLDGIIQRQGPLPEEMVLNWASQLLDALNVCHTHNVIHRDIKPQNIIICPNGRAVLVDFGLVKLWDPNQPQTQRIIQGLGTREYSSPEQYGIGISHTEPRSDIYSLGATLYHALTGIAPASAIDRYSEPSILKPFHETGVMVNPQTEAVIFQSMALNPYQRFATTKLMKTALLTASLPSAHAYPTAASFQKTTVMPKQQPVSINYLQEFPTPIPQLPAERTIRQNPTWYVELGTAVVIAIVGTFVSQAILWRFRVWIPMIGICIGAIFAGALGWFIGDTIYQAITYSPSTLPSAAGNRPTQRLVMSTHKLMQKLSILQQIALLVAVLFVVILAAWLLGPIFFDIPILWNNFPSYAIAGVLVYSAVGRKAGMVALAHTLAIFVGGMVLKTTIGIGLSVWDYLLSAIGGGIFMELTALIVDRTLIKPRKP
jgi:serine/threonine protein kinase